MLIDKFTRHCPLREIDYLRSSMLLTDRLTLPLMVWIEICRPNQLARAV